MNWKTIEAIARSHSPDPRKPQYYYKIADLSAIIGVDRNDVPAFLHEHRVPPYSVSRAKIYFLPDVLEAIDGTRWRDEDKRGKNGA